MKKILLATVAVLLIAGCGITPTSTLSENPQETGDEIASLLPNKPMEAGNDGRIQQYLEGNLIDSENAICNFDMLNQPNGNVVEVWALCEEFMLLDGGTLDKGRTMSLPVKVTFANPTLYVIPGDGEAYVPSINENFSKESIEKILSENRYDVSALETKNMDRAKKWLIPVVEQIKAEVEIEVEEETADIETEEE